jgi:putative oxidoreductase
MIVLVSAAVGALGGGDWSVDAVLGLEDDLRDGAGLAIALGAGLGGALLVLATSWRRASSSSPAQ